MAVGASVLTLVAVGETAGLLVVPEVVGPTVPIGMASVGANEVVSMVGLLVVGVRVTIGSTVGLVEVGARILVGPLVLLLEAIVGTVVAELLGAGVDGREEAGAMVGIIVPGLGTGVLLDVEGDSDDAISLPVLLGTLVEPEATTVGEAVGINGGVFSTDGSAVMVADGARIGDDVGTATGAAIVGVRSVGALVGLRVTGGIVGGGGGPRSADRVKPRLNPTASKITMTKDKQAHPRANIFI